MPEIPEAWRPSIAAALNGLVDGSDSANLTWVAGYGAHGATLVDQPEAIWSHAYNEWGIRDDGTGWAVLPLWTTNEAPSDLSAELDIDAHGTATLYDVHVR